MSAAPEGVDPSEILEGPDRYVRFAEDVLGLQLASTQKEILRAIAKHERVVVVSGNGVGKSYTVAIAIAAFLFTNLDATVLGTSGSYSQFVDAAWRPLKALHKEAKQRIGLPGNAMDGGQPELRIDDEWFAKIVSPRDPGDLEGRHAENMLVVIEEADKAYITPEHFDSAGSSITDGNDRMLAVANPPEDEADVVYEKMESDRWHTIQFSSFDSHNVQVELGEADGPKIPGLIDTDTIREDWVAWNAEPWPGLDEARTAHERRDDLDSRWYRRRAGVIPPEGASAHRPIHHKDVEAAWERTPDVDTIEPEATGVDVARSGDRTVATSVHGNALRTHYAEQGTNHVEQAEDLTALLEQWDDHPVAVDAVGEGSGLEDMLSERFPETIRFNAGGTPENGTEFYDRWAEGLALLGQWLREGGSIDDRKLREELLVASRTLQYEERHMASRGLSGADVLKLTPKKELKERLGRSPDLLDAAYMAVWARDSGATAGIPTATASLAADDDEEEITPESRQFRESEVGGAIHKALEGQRGDPF